MIHFSHDPFINPTLKSKHFLQSKCHIGNLFYALKFQLISVELQTLVKIKFKTFFGTLLLTYMPVNQLAKLLIRLGHSLSECV